MNPYHVEIQNMIRQTPTKPLNGFNPVRYLGTTHTFLGIITNNKKLIAKNFHATHPDLTFDELIHLLDALNKGETFEEKTIAPFILERYKKYKHDIIPTNLKKWLTSLQGWGEVDSLCQNFFEGKELLAHFCLMGNLIKTVFST